MVKFEIKPYGNDGDMMLVRSEIGEPVNGLPPSKSTTIFMNEKELTILMDTLKKYANEK